jgi:hypothetical protein
MPHQIKLNEELGVVVVRHDGKIDITELRQVLDELVALPGFQPGLKVVSDFRGSETPLTGDEIRGLAEYARRAHHAVGTTKWAIIASNTLTYGLARMYSALNQDFDVTIHVFHDLEELNGWLELGLSADDILARTLV